MSYVTIQYVKGKTYGKDRWEIEVQQYCFFNILISALNVGGWSKPFRDRFSPKKEARCSLYRTDCGPSGPAWTNEKNFYPPPVFDSRIVQLAASPSTDWTIAALNIWTVSVTEQP